MNNMNLKTEPVSLPSALTAALLATWNVIAMVTTIEPDITAAGNIMIGAWVAFLAFWMRGKVSPVG